MAKINPLIPTVDIHQQEPTGDQLISLGTVQGTPPAGATYASLFALECILQDVDGSGIYQMTGTVAVPAWSELVSDATVALDVVNELVTTAGGAATENFSTGDFADVVATDTVFVQLVDDGTGNVSVLSAEAKAGSVDIVFSADPVADTIVSVLVKRA